MIFPLYPYCFQFAEQFRQANVSGFISGLAGVDAQRISGKALFGTCRSDQDYIQPLTVLTTRNDGIYYPEWQYPSNRIRGTASPE